MGPGRFELPTSPLSGVRSNQLSYEPDALAFVTAQFNTQQPQLASNVGSLYFCSFERATKKTAALHCQRFRSRDHNCFAMAA